ncbi:hypothetical protein METBISCDRAFT_26951 [Metschnikowia bicuspidata]|uniref:Efficient mitochondria targeting-associated protein 19 n=1 Tax=Metschnikowia bicuspidata TaxID=27322 RepID=A0A4P9ZDI7_9ASCO|nr:hypothetical protein METBISCDRAFT_26951 [Metschnikowia bicuspidata]
MNKRDTFYFLYFIIHIPITILMDSSIIVPQKYLYPTQQYLVDLHLLANKDFLLQNPPLWLKYFGAFEVFFQLPFFFIATYMLYKGSRSVLTMMSLYGFNAFFTTGMCLAYVLVEAGNHGLSTRHMLALFGLYTPYFVIPLVMMVDCSARAMGLIRTAEAVAVNKKTI